MVFAPEDKRAWQDSQVMLELEKIAKEYDLLNGPPKEAFEPIEEESESWEEEDLPPDKLAPDKSAAFSAESGRLMANLLKLAYDLADAEETKAAYRIERALRALKDIFGGK